MRQVRATAHPLSMKLRVLTGSAASPGTAHGFTEFGGHAGSAIHMTSDAQYASREHRPLKFLLLMVNNKITSLAHLLMNEVNERDHPE